MKGWPLLLAVLVPGCLEDRTRTIHNGWPEPVKVFVDYEDEWFDPPMAIHLEYKVEAGGDLTLSYSEDEIPVRVIVLRSTTGEWIYRGTWWEDDFRHDDWLTPPD